VKAVADIGSDNWAAVAELFPNRNARQCRDRWSNYLSPSVENGPWTADEEELLIKKHAELGTAWKYITRFFPTRTDINIKSRWQQIQRRQRKVPEVPVVVKVEEKPEKERKPDDLFEGMWREVATDDLLARIFFNGSY
jgi:hypothetical protein